MRQGARHPGTWLWVLLLAPLLVPLSLQAASGFVVTRVEPRLVDDLWMLDASVDYEFSDTALEALENGVPLTLEVRVQVRRDGAWLWEASLIDQRHLYMIRYQPLSELYQVTHLPEGERISFVSRSAAISHLGDVEDLRLLPRGRVRAGESYSIRVKASLDIEALPLPLRPVAYLKPSWNLSSGWSEWPLSE